MDIRDTICNGCLSSNRSLSALNIGTKSVLRDAIGKMDYSQDIWMCWECSAILRKFLKFKLRVQRAQSELDRYTHNINTSVTSLSNLTITKQSTINNNVEFEESCDMPTVFVKVEEISNEVVTIDPEFHVFNDETHSYDSNDSHSDNEKGISDHVNEDIDKNKDLRTKEKIKVKKKTRIKTKVIFNESDDEPLKSKSEEEKGDQQSKVKKKEGLKQNKKREKPPGVITNARVTKKLEQLNVSGDQLEMVLLSWEEVERDRQAGLLHPSFTRHQSRCEDCVLGFNHPLKLDEHIKKHQPIVGGEQCAVCRVWCKDGRALAAHKRRHRLRWRCRTCGQTWSQAANAADHTARAHDAPPPTHVCAMCGHNAPTLGKLRSHVRGHSERQTCGLCGKTCRDRAALRTHLFIHKGDKRYACPRCDKRFLFKSAMEIHRQTHDDSAQLYCHQCDVTFKNRMSYNQHMRYNLKHIDPAKLKYACGLCDKRFAKSSRLSEHNVAVHLKLTPVACTVQGCHFSCSSRPVLRTHIRMQHRDGRGKRNHVCHLCGKAYASKNSLEGHLRAHSGERPLRCPRCPAAFGYDAALYNHVKHVHLKHKKVRIRVPQTGDWSLPIPAPADET